MATNPMQRKARNSFLLGMLLAILIAAIIVVLLYMKIKSQNEEINKYKLATQNVYVLNNDVKSGQVLTADMFKMVAVPKITIPTEANAIATQTTLSEVLNQRSFCDTDGDYIYYSGSGYYLRIDGKQCDVYTINEENAETVAKYLTVGQNAHYYLDDNKTQRRNITIATNATISKIDLQANTIVTTSMIARGNEITTNDLREQEYNVISLPVELMTGDYVDIRLMLPNGQDYIVVSKKNVSVPMVNGVYLADTIKMKLTEKEILTLSCAIVESYQIEGAKLYATKYAEAGLQTVATTTYRPTDEVIGLINSDVNIVDKAISGIRDRIDTALQQYGNTDNVPEKAQGSVTSGLEARRQYLQSLTSVE